MTTWKEVRGDVQPKEIDTTTSGFVVYERRNIRQETVTDPMTGDERTGWVYDEREYTKDEYAQLNSPATQAILNAVSQAAENTASWDALTQAIQEGVNSVE